MEFKFFLRNLSINTSHNRWHYWKQLLVRYADVLPGQGSPRLATLFSYHASLQWPFLNESVLGAHAHMCKAVQIKWVL